MELPTPLRRPVGLILGYFGLFAPPASKPLVFWLALGAGAGVCVGATSLFERASTVATLLGLLGLLALAPIILAKRRDDKSWYVIARLKYDYWKRLLALLLVYLIAGGLAPLIEGGLR